MTPRIRTPHAFAEAEQAVKLYIANLPPNFKDPLRPKEDGSGYDVDIDALAIVSRSTCDGLTSHIELIPAAASTLYRTRTLRPASCTSRTSTTTVAKTASLWLLLDAVSL
jgi:hypothetical protein